ncbi:hypothetical protein PGT21_023122 [Puccinia graminis f. sp. tritici]|uniref:Uncharacterized protein n=1 Tax=Puccinia graminis f. sp. tritici TaxID=56615 RepID=A0A5B0PEC5_PUCGR|nr:hypothetical protein PGTUg99_001098 [Puccinia graminis f. sp. tritici]KAA1112112.1 hypothetical protein PGT21_023122 [Puccinia graminis f. sp. tritici]KAA1124954.1 hypothetical protein PGTUg99_001103 [Puccinia graminis f. sp. tritici]
MLIGDEDFFYIPDRAPSPPTDRHSVPHVALRLEYQVSKMQNSLIGIAIQSSSSSSSNSDPAGLF